MKHFFYSLKVKIKKVFPKILRIVLNDIRKLYIYIYIYIYIYKFQFSINSILKNKIKKTKYK